MRRISALYQKYGREHGIDLSLSLAMCHDGDTDYPFNVTKAPSDCRPD
jgi:hypothetical protein